MMPSHGVTTKTNSCGGAMAQQVSDCGCRNAATKRNRTDAQPRTNDYCFVSGKGFAHRLALGEAYFASKLLDYDLSANNGNWQWAAGCGCDAAPYFRIFNPAEQTKRYDPELKYIRRWVPKINEFGYPAPIVDHSMALNVHLKHSKRL